jgi:hypothetical protein
MIEITPEMEELAAMPDEIAEMASPSCAMAIKLARLAIEERDHVSQ